MEKRRKRKKRESSDHIEHVSMFKTQIKQEIDENKYSEDSSDIPMNLTSTKQSRYFQKELSSNKNQVPTVFDQEPIANKSKAFGPNGLDEDDNNQYIFCKKVRQAQQLKMTANAANSLSNPFRDNSMVIPNVSNSETPNEMIMPLKIPSKRKQKREVNAQIKMKYLEWNDIQSESATESNDHDIKNGDLKEEFILPRERFISICNMDRNALDHYLNANEENSQDLELLQYFDEDKNRKADCIVEDLGSASTSVPVLENYQLYNEGGQSNKPSDKISQLRCMLEEKQYTSVSLNAGGESVIKNFIQKASQQVSTVVFDSDAINGNGAQTGNGALYSNVSSRLPHHNATQHVRQIDQIESTSGCGKKLSQSPNTRRKNFSFVPIPAQSVRAKNINLHPVFKNDAHFVSPRVTNISRSALLNASKSQESFDSSKSTPVIGINSNTAFRRPDLLKLDPTLEREEQSPSTRPNYNHCQQKQQDSSEFLFQLVSGQNASHGYPLESRSQSVPPHSTNTGIYNVPNNYSSSCCSMTSTPAVSDYQEFPETTILDIFNSEQAEPLPSIKLEHLLDHGVLNQNSVENQSTRQTFINSRSVPNTPLPHQNNFGNMNSFCPIGKSVPTTPIGNMTFRYSPELQRTRDFLINGFNNNNRNIVSNNEHKILGESLSNEMDDLSNLDTSLLNTL